MGFVRFMQSWAGRVLRIAAGGVIVWYGLTQMTGTAGTVVTVLGFVPIAAGLFSVCLLGPLFGAPLRGQPPA